GPAISNVAGSVFFEHGPQIDKLLPKSHVTELSQDAVYHLNLVSCSLQEN
ncbi:hypothetical protein S83_066979, partial [Arachis hypogaea]